jgi:retron-type reverse transcriptase
MNLLTTDYGAIYSAWQNFIKGKKKTPTIDQFSYNLETNLLALCKDINDGSYRHGPYVGHIINEKKRRDIAVATVRDRIVHRLLYDHLIEIWDKTLDPDVYSCRKDKGLHKALHRTQQLLSRHYDSFIWRADVTKFFDSVDRTVLLDILRGRIDNNDPTLGLCSEILKSHNLKESGIRNQESGIRNQESGIRNQESGIRNQESGIRNQESGIYRQPYLSNLFEHLPQRIRPLCSSHPKTPSLRSLRRRLHPFRQDRTRSWWAKKKCNAFLSPRFKIEN